MADLNRANRQCCDLDIRSYEDGSPILFADFCNTTTAGFTSDSVFAMKKGAKAIGFQNPMEGTMSCTFQVHPFKVYALLSDGNIETTGVKASREVVKCATEGEIDITGTPAGDVFVYRKGEWGETAIAGTLSGTKFTATQASDIEANKEYEVGYVTNLSDVKRVVFNNDRIPKDHKITMSTLDKNELGQLVPCTITAYKATIQRSMELSFSSEGEPAEITLTWDCMEDADHNVLDIIEG